MTLDFKASGDKIYLIGKQVEDIACSEYVYRWHKVSLSPAPYFNLDEEFALYQAIRTLTSQKLVKSAHDLSEGGLAIALLEAGFPGGFGFDIATGEMRKDAFLFGEASGRIIASVSSTGAPALEAALEAAGVPYAMLGTVTGGEVKVDGKAWGNIEHFRTLFNGALEKKLFGQ
jgi:phosphoribosylformylglycinamidine synthase